MFDKSKFRMYAASVLATQQTVMGRGWDIMASYMTYTYRDYSGEASSFFVNTAPIDAASIAGIETALGTLKTAVGNITLGQLAQERLQKANVVSIEPASDTGAAREKKWLVIYHAASNPTKLYRVELPCADTSGTHLQTNSDEADYADADIAAFISGFEAVAKTPDTGAAVTVKSMHLVGRNL